jgi:hypothetical protein
MNPRPHWVDFVAPYVWLMFWALDFLMGLFPSLYLTNRLLSLWPSVEFRMGHEWQQLVKRRRDRLWAFFTIAIVPLVLSYVYDLLKIFWTR